ncbi:FAD-dependent oxidoreductase [Pseudobacteriovorax antillogorgiicola]|uniref:Predicted NAD/FAD-binding protein n=1 Tax=Pseudobacteriovorax antillogorgiicola TaxID=1513793 RepID=A0A1Y6BUK3_9BACT|nr:FAD-dependent oxidoreductase [Pseudobacteriovorax antillogorgiicola]TCS53889.1 putative NAD/FAD-binding protein [Pseudobacteriovorax antillogorgiicola]SMF20933.1 Predicted NAD/FAD-binding protein [Pseudobacteriovorax antillogorgiicola]
MAQTRIAVVGSGIAGLTAGWLMSKKHHVTLLEKGPSLGMAQHGVDAGTAQGDKVVDVPLRVFNKSYYPNLFLLCQNLNIDLRMVDHGGAFGYLNGDLYFRYENIAIGGKNYSYVLPKMKQLPWLLKVGWEILRLRRDMKEFLERDDCDEVRLAKFFEDFKYSRAFQYEFFFPILSSVCTCSYSALMEYPAGILIHGMQTLMETTPTQRFIGGTRALQANLAKSIQNVRYDSHVVRIEPSPKGAVVHYRDGVQEEYDHVILATQANQAREVLDVSYEEERSLLERIIYQTSDMIVHRDERLMPGPARKWSPVYYGISSQYDWPMATIWINKVEPGFEEGEPLFQTWNPLIPPDEDKVLGRTTFERPVVSLDSLKAVNRLANLQKDSLDKRHIWFCGSYGTPAIPLLESGLVSAVQLGEHFGVAKPSWFVEPSR